MSSRKLQLYKFKPFLGPCEDWPIGSVEWAERISCRLQAFWDSQKRNTAYILCKTLKAMHDGQPWNVWPKGKPFGNPDALCRAVTGHSWKALNSIIAEMTGDRTILGEIERDGGGDYTFAEMRRALVRGWGELGARTADDWLDFNRRYFGGKLEPIPIFFTNTMPFGRRIGFCVCDSQCTHIALNVPRDHAQLVADRAALLHEMIHQYLGQRGENPKHAGAPWRREIMRLHRKITGVSIWAGKPIVAKVKEAGGQKNVRRMEPHPETGEASLTQMQIARWPHDRGINLGSLMSFS